MIRHLVHDVGKTLITERFATLLRPLVRQSDECLDRDWSISESSGTFEAFGQTVLVVLI